MAKLDDILSGQVLIGGVRYVAREMKCNGKVVWPLNYTYSLVSGSMKVNYSEGTQLYADGSNYAEVSDEDDGEEFDYVLNINSKKFHYPDCGSARSMSEKNRQEYTGTRAILIKNGYKPCNDCKP